MSGKIVIAIIVISSAFLAPSCINSEKNAGKVVVVRQSDICREKIGVEGMVCVGCEVTLEEQIYKLEGVVQVKASHKKKEIEIEFDTTRTNLKDIQAQIKEAGYKVISTDLK